MLTSTSFSNVFSKNDVKLMGLNDFGTVMSFFPAFGMKTTFAILQAVGMSPKARLLISIFLIVEAGLAECHLDQETCRAGMYNLPILISLLLLVILLWPNQ